MVEAALSRRIQVGFIAGKGVVVTMPLPVPRKMYIPSTSVDLRIPRAVFKSDATILARTGRAEPS